MFQTHSCCRPCVILPLACVAIGAMLVATSDWKERQSKREAEDRLLLERRIAKLLKKHPVALIETHAGSHVRHWKKGSKLKKRHFAWIHAHSSEENDAPIMPQLELHVAADHARQVDARLKVVYQRGNGARTSRSIAQDTVTIPADGGFRTLEDGLWKIHEDSDYLAEIDEHGFFGGNAVLTYRLNGSSEHKTIRFRIAGENPEDKRCERYIQSFPQTGEGEKLEFMAAIARHESKHKNRSNVYYNQFLEPNTYGAKGGYPTWNNDGGLTPGGYGVFQVTGTAEDPDANIRRDAIWNWQSNVQAAFDIINHQFKGSLAKRYFKRIKKRFSNGKELFEECPPPDITVAGETFSAKQAVWITAYNGWGGHIKNRFTFSPQKPCGLGPNKRWHWNPPVKPNGKTYLHLVAEEMQH